MGFLFACLLALAVPARVEDSSAPLILKTDGGDALVNPDGTLTYVSDLTDQEKLDLGIGDPSLIRTGATSEERRRASTEIMQGCRGDIQCWRRRMGEWDAANGRESSFERDQRERREARGVPPPPAPAVPSREEQIRSACAELGRKSHLNSVEHTYYGHYCI